MPEPDPIRVTVTDPKTGEVLAEKILQPGNYTIICVPPCRLDSQQHHANGTTVLTLKGRRADLITTAVTGG